MSLQLYLTSGIFYSRQLGQGYHRLVKKPKGIEICLFLVFFSHILHIFGICVLFLEICVNRSFIEQI